MRDLPDLLRRMVLDTVRAEAVQVAEHVVSAVNGDGTVTLGYDETAISNVSCASAYMVRAIGDKVLVIKIGAGSWYVLAKAESSGSDGAVSLKDLYDAIDNLHSQVLTEIPASLTVQFGSGGVPSGFSTASSVGVRDDGTGNFTLYLGGVSGTASQRPLASSTPASRTIGVAGFGSWAETGETDPSTIQQGGQPQWMGAWFYGNSIALSAQGKNVKSISMALARTNSGTAAPVRAYFHDGVNANTQPNLIDGPLAPFSLAPSEKRTWTLPASWRTALTDPANPAKGIAVKSGSTDEYINFTTTSGTLTVAFAAS